MYIINIWQLQVSHSYLQRTYVVALFKLSCHIGGNIAVLPPMLQKLKMKAKFYDLTVPS